MRYAFDIETNLVDFKSGNFIEEVHTVHCLVLMNLDTKKIYRYYDTDTLRIPDTYPIRHGIKELEEADEIVGHNIIQFDIPVLRKLYGFKPTGRVTDTLVTSRTLYPDRVGGHSLREWGERLGDSKGDPGDFGFFSPQLLEYCVQDVRLTGEVYKRLQAEARDGDWTKAIELEHRIAEIIAEQERNGFYFDKEKAESYIRQWDEEINDIDNRIRSRVLRFCVPGPTVNTPFKINGQPAVRTLRVAGDYGIDPELIAGPFCVYSYEYPDLNSKDQQKEILLALGWKPRYTTKTGAPQLCDSIKEVGEVGERLARRNVVSHRRNQVSGLILLADKNGRVHGGANPCGTNTSRMRHQRIVNIPRVSSELGYELRSLFCAPPGRVLVGYDAKGLELRILAHYINNGEYNERVTTADKRNDAHVLAARAAGSTDRDLGKTINYALIYGAGDRKLGSIIGADETAGARLREELYASIPGLGELVTRAKAAAKRGYVLGIDGRKLWLRQRVSPLNTLIQGSGSIFMKTVAKHLDEVAKGLPIAAVKVIDMHDEAQWECLDDAAEIELLGQAIRSAFTAANYELGLTCPQEPEVKIGQNWAETH